MALTEFKKIIEIRDRLLAPNGCPWDLKQTLDTLQPYLLEETHELLEAIDLKDKAKMAEELGDVLYTLLFIAKVAEKENLFSLSDSLNLIGEKLIRRHPHIFGDTEVKSAEEVVKNWNEIKKNVEGRKNSLGDIPPSLPALLRAQKVISKIKNSLEKGEDSSFGARLFELVREMEEKNLDAESELRRYTKLMEEKHRR